MTMDGDLILAEAIKRLGIDLRPLVAACAVWAHPSTFEAVRKIEHGRGAVRLAAEGVVSSKGWEMSQSRRSPRYTTRLEDLPVVRA